MKQLNRVGWAARGGVVCLVDGQEVKKCPTDNLLPYSTPASRGVVILTMAMSFQTVWKRHDRFGNFWAKASINYSFCEMVDWPEWLNLLRPLGFLNVSRD